MATQRTLVFESIASLVEAHDELIKVRGKLEPGGFGDEHGEQLSPEDQAIDTCFQQAVARCDEFKEWIEGQVMALGRLRVVEEDRGA